MADISRNTFTLTNLLHQFSTDTIVDEPRHYVGVRQQQGRVLVDADSNEERDIQKIQTEFLIKNYFGDGVPSDSNGFQIGAVTGDNNFTIAIGIIMVDGKLVFNHHESLTYTEQETVFSVSLDTTLAPPASLTRDDLVYLDTWEEEVVAIGSDNADERLVNNTIGVETSTRIERRWLVRVLQDSATISLDDITTEEGHSYSALARIARSAGENQIDTTRIFDLRRTDINVAKYLKIPVFLQQGVVTVNSDSFADLLEFLRNVLLTRLENEVLFVDVSNMLNMSLVHFSIQQILQVCNSGALQARTKNLTNADAIAVLNELVNAQSSFIGTLTAYGAGGAAMDQFLLEFNNYLSGGDGETGVADPLAEADLIGAYRGQQALNTWLSADVGTLPEGNVQLSYVDITPLEALQVGSVYRVFVEVVSGVQSNSDSGDEVFDVNVSLSSSLWSVEPATREITIANDGGTGTVFFDITVGPSDISCELDVVAQVRNNPSIRSVQLPFVLQTGQTPVINPVLVYAHTELNESNQMPISAVDLQSGFSPQIGFALNNSDVSEHTYTLEWFITLDDGEADAGWNPIDSARDDREDTVAAETNGGTNLRMSAPAGPDIVGFTGTLHVSITLIDGLDINDVADGPDIHETLAIDFLVE